ncbi:MAG: hypothetical protein ACR2OU_07650 [Thermomicrobiales bacterium]
MRDSIGDRVSNELSTQVANQLGRSGVALQPGTHVLSVADLQQQMEASGFLGNDTQVTLAVSPTGLTVSIDSNGQTIGYTGVPAARNGKLVIDDLTSDNDVLGFILPSDKMATAIEKGANGYFAAQGLEISDLTLGNGTITFDTVSAS